MRKIIDVIYEQSPRDTDFSRPQENPYYTKRNKVKQGTSVKRDGDKITVE